MSPEVPESVASSMRKIFTLQVPSWFLAASIDRSTGRCSWMQILVHAVMIPVIVYQVYHAIEAMTETAELVQYEKVRMRRLSLRLERDTTSGLVRHIVASVLREPSGPARNTWVVRGLAG